MIHHCVSRSGRTAWKALGRHCEENQKKMGFKRSLIPFSFALGQWHPTATINKSVEGSWTSFVDTWWGSEMDLNYDPTETVRVGMERQFGLEPRVESEAAGVVGERDPPPNG